LSLQAHIERIPGDYGRYYDLVRTAILNKGPNPVTGEEAVRVMKVLEAGLKSAKEGKKVFL